MIKATITINGQSVKVAFNSQQDAMLTKESLMKRVRDSFKMLKEEHFKAVHASKPVKKNYKITEKQLLRRIAMRMAKESAMSGNGCKSVHHFKDDARKELLACRI